MARKRLFWKLLPSYLLITLVALFAVTFYARYAVRDFYTDQLLHDLRERAVLFENQLRDHLRPLDTEAINALCHRLSDTSETRYTVVLANGEVVGDSRENPAIMDNHAMRPEIAEALEGATGTSTRFSHTLQKNFVYVANPIDLGNELAGVVRVSLPLTDVEKRIQDISVKILGGGMFVALLAAFMSLGMARQLSQPLEQMTHAARQFAQGDFGGRIPAQSSEELDHLADSMNWMARQLDEKVSTIQRQRHEQDAVLSSMVEGVLAVDTDERVIDLNLAASELFDIRQGTMRGRSIQEAVRNPDLQHFVTRVLKSRQPLEEDIVLIKDGEERSLQVHGTVLRDAQSNAIGALIVLHDISRLRRLERVRREFVANVSHELKTPITSIKGFVETLLEGAMEDKDDAQKFLQIIAKHADRLTTIIDDLLSLSRIEQEQERGLSETSSTSIKGLLESAVEICAAKAAEKDMHVTLSVEEGLRENLKPHLIEQAVVNLIDNAIKYSEKGKTVDVRARREGEHLTISVRDQGSGISLEHQARLFERFYRVDKARSREMGGTGLGLAIVKHIAIAHGGVVDVDSKLGEGSMFTLRIPHVSEEEVT